MNAAPAPRISVVIGTLNRGEALGISLDSLAAQDLSRDRFEVIVVDNGCTDGTEALVRAKMAQMPNLRLVKESRLGLSAARNKGISEARYELVAFFDDDATAEKDWLTLLTGIFAEDPAAGAAGGPIYVGWPISRPVWMPKACEGYFGHCYYGEERTLLEFPKYPYGSNMVIRKEHLLAINGFNEKVGPKGGNMMSAGEQDLFSRLAKIPVKVVYEPRASVMHWVQAERVTRKWTLQRSHKHGLSNTRMMANIEPYEAGRLLSQCLLYPWRVLMSYLSAFTGWLTRKPPDVVMARLANTYYWRGVARGTFIRLMAGKAK